MTRLRIFFKYLYSLDQYWGVDKVTLWHYLYAKRIGVRTAWRISREINKLLKDKS